MKYTYIILMISFACTSSSPQTEQITSTDSVKTSPIETVSDEVASEEPAREEPSEEPETEEQYDSVFSSEPINLTNFAQDPLGHNQYETIIEELNQAGIQFTDSQSDGVHEISFGQCFIRVLTSEAYGDLICSARIYCTRYPLPENVKLGMPVDNFLSRTSLTRDSLTVDGEALLYYERTAGGTNVGGTSTVRFNFLEEKLVGIEYGFDPCMIYD